MVITLLSRRISSAAGSRRASTARTYAPATWSPSRANRRPRDGGYSRAPWSSRISAAASAFLAAGGSEPSISPNSSSTRSARWPARISGGQTTSANRLATCWNGTSARACPAGGVGAEDGPANLGPPFRLVRGVGRAAQVVLAQRSVDADLVPGGVGTKCGVAEVGIAERPVVADDGQLGRWHRDRRDPPDGAHAALHRDEHGRLAALVLEQLARVQPHARASGVQPLRPDGRVQLAQGALPPGQKVGLADDRGDTRRLDGRDAAVLDHRCALRWLQQVAQRLDRGPGLRQFGLESAQMRGDERVAGRGVGRTEDRLDLADRHLQIPQPTDNLRGRHLRGGVVAVARAGVHGGRLQQADLVIMPQRLDAQVSDTGEVTDSESCCHPAILNPPLTGQSIAERGLDPPARGP